jgi:superfamily I DNA and/or RNA helicase
MKAPELLDKYNDITALLGKERALYNLLKANESRIYRYINEDETCKWFHKALRQVDVTECSYVDMAIYYLLNEAQIFWNLIEGKYEL